MKALILGATGATGRDLTKILLEDKDFSEVHIFVRKPLNIKDLKLETHIVNFVNFESWRDLVSGNIAFSCLGTTLKVAGSKEAQRKVDYDYQLNFAKSAKENDVENFVLVSSYGANPNSKIFYSRMKGELEEAIKNLNFDKTTFFQPGMLERKNSERFGEVVGLKLLKLANKMALFKSQKPLPTKTLAKAMVNAAKIKSNGLAEIKLSTIFSFAK